MTNVINATFLEPVRPFLPMQWYVFIKWQNMLEQKQYKTGQR